MSERSGIPGRQLPDYRKEREAERRDSEYHRVPSLHDHRPENTAGYPNWRPEDTRVITVSIGVAGRAYKSNHLAESKEAARQLVTKRYGRIFEENAVLGRGFYRVMKAKK